ncbi:MAG: prefoldin subunit alpha [Candidatus Altiarchaeales archaeon]|nr:prefoldin subunit alpha [Candidatus Altiarchaeales archaeon]MBD3416290.1 prefoldin subunit alpha [Candidatus Altiarchaeales archaeon]
MDEELRNTLMQLETGKRQLDQLGKQGQMIESAILELTSTVEALKSLESQKTGSEVLVPFGAGSYITASLKDTESVLVDIGAGYSVEKKLPDAIVTLEGRRKHLTQSLQQLNKTMGEMAVRMGELNTQAEAMMGQHSH